MEQHSSTEAAATTTRQRWPLVTAVAAALAVALGVYLLIEAGVGGAVGYTMLVILPAALCAFVAWAGSHRRNWRRSTYFLIPVWLSLAMTVIGALFLREGVICVLMVLPLWMGFGMLGVWPVYLHRQRRDSVDRDVFSANALLLLPLLALIVDQQVTPPRDTYVVTRDVIVNASAAQSWQALLAIPAIAPDEGRWNVSQSLLRLPRPVDSTLVGCGIGAVREARWQDGISFQEIVTDWHPGREISWRFAFPDPSIHLRTDRHINPQSRQLQVERGGYRVIPLADGRTRIQLWTHYAMATPVNDYAAMWGELILGDIQANVLSIVAARLEDVDG